jgi:hypothetical protein
VAALVDLLIVGELVVALVDIQAEAQITVNIHMPAAAAQAARTIHQHMELAQVAGLDYTVKDQAVKDFILRGAEITHQVAAEMADQAVILDIGVKIHGAELAIVQTIFKEALMVVEEEDLALVGQRHLAMDILALFEYYGELL